MFCDFLWTSNFNDDEREISHWGLMQPIPSECNDQPPYGNIPRC